VDDERDDRDSRQEPAPQQPRKESGGILQLAVQATTLGWNLVIPIVGGVLLGRYLDDKSGQEFTWTLSLLVLGVIVAFNNLYAMYIEHGRVKPSQERDEKHRQREPGESEHHAEDK
jgi:predicted F0F1-ATPase subunit